MKAFSAEWPGIKAGLCLLGAVNPEASKHTFRSNLVSLTWLYFNVYSCPEKGGGQTIEKKIDMYLLCNLHFHLKIYNIPPACFSHFVSK